MLLTTPDQSDPSTSNKHSKPSPASPPPPPPKNKWRNGAQERIYGRKLIEGIRSARGEKAVKEAADSALALTAKGQSRWSRAILANRCKRVKVQKAIKARRRRPPKPHVLQLLPSVMVEKEGERKVGERLRKLGKLVPGCRKLPTTSLLEEAADYVAALEMQVKAMRSLAEALSSASISQPTTTVTTDSGGPTEN